MSKSPQLQALLGAVLQHIPPPNGGTDYAASHTRNRKIQELVHIAIIEIAEAQIPGLKDFLADLYAKEREFLRKSGPLA